MDNDVPMILASVADLICFISGGCTMSELADFCVGSVIVLLFLWWSSLNH